MPDETSRYFTCKDVERAAFEAGIKMGTLYHQFVGMPVSLRNVEDVERLIEKSISVQPYVSQISVRIRKEMLPSLDDGYGYTSLHGDMLDAKIVLKYEKVVVTAKIDYVKELEYPLMRITSVEGRD